jgi:alpha-glucosidase (family GH31 glycosyl hydrolase)
MNEPVNFASGDLFEGCEINNLNTPPYIPHIQNRILWDGTLCPDSVDSISTHYNTHSMYGWFEAIATKTAMLEARPGNRSFILSRSTFIGSGKYTAHWLGDNFSVFEYLYININIYK